MINLMAFLLATGLGFGLACWICGTILNKSNNIGDSIGSGDEYRAFVTFTARRDRISGSERNNFSSLYGKNLNDPYLQPCGNEKVRRLSQEELDSYKYKAQKRETLQNQALNSYNEPEDEFDLWQKKHTDTDMTGVFKPYNGN